MTNKWRHKTRILVAMIAVGALLGPLYSVYCMMFSGNKVGSYSISGSRSSVILSDGSKQDFPSGRAASPIVLNLDPMMNPIELLWTGTVYGGPPRGRGGNQYRASLFFGGRVVTRETFSVDPGREGGHMSVAVKILAVEEPGRYDLVIEETEPGIVGVGSMHIEARRNVLRPWAPVLWAGWALLVTGMVLLLFGQVTTSEGKHASLWRLAFLVGAAALICAAILGSFFYFVMPN